jgi:hypothetical protein
MRSFGHVGSRALVATVALVASCGSTSELTEPEVSRCLEVSRESGSIAGSDQTISLVALELPEDAVAPAGATAAEVEETYDRAFHDLYGIHVDEFLALRQTADDVTTERHGDPPALGELLSDEWFHERDAVLIDAWNETHPDSVRIFCELITGNSSP